MARHRCDFIFLCLAAAVALIACWGAAAQERPGIPDPPELPGLHPFFALRTSLAQGGVILDKPKSTSTINLESPSGQQFIGATVGADWGRYWGGELSLDTFESDIKSPTFGKLSDYNIWTAMANARFRYPIPSYRLQPYAVVGIGTTIAEANDRNVLNSNLQFNGPLDTSFVAGVGVGLEYFLAENIALGVEVKHRFLTHSHVQFQGTSERLNLDSTAFSVGLRMYLDDGPGATAPTWLPTKAADSDEFRGYLALRSGGGFVPDGSTDVGVSAQSSGVWLGSFALGANFNRYWGAEFAADFAPGTELKAAPFGKVAKYTYWTLLGQMRARYPMWNDRVSPYLLLGGGIGAAEVNKRRVSFQDFPLNGGTTTSPVAAVGAGFDYFIARNLAVGIEAKHIVPFRPEITVAGQTSKVHLDPVFLTAGVRVLFP
ncbi:MAG: outer membrane beta-barrel protein [Alphaproteobacteria bacterium]